MRVRRLPADERPVKIIRPHRGEGAHVPRHARHEARDQRRDAQAEQSGPAVARQHQRQDFIVAVLPRPHRTLRRQMKGEHRKPQQAGQNHDERHRHLEV